MKSRKFFLILIVSVLGGVGIGGAFVFLRGPVGSRYLMGKLQGYIASEMHAQLEFKEVRIEPFSSVHFEELKFHQDSSSNRLGVQAVDIQMGLFDLQFSFSLSLSPTPSFKIVLMGASLSRARFDMERKSRDSTLSIRAD